MGTEMTEQRGLYAGLFNCGFRSTARIKEEGSAPFAFLMDASMLGVGVGFDLKGAGTFVVKGADVWKEAHCVIPDSREGWVESVARLIDAFFRGGPLPRFDYSLIRPAGAAIVGFGGVASGPAPLQALHGMLEQILGANTGRPITETTIVDVMNLIGKCVVAGNVRRTAEIVFGDPNSEEYLNLKNYAWDAERGKYTGPMAYRAGWGWTSNNSVFCEVGQEYGRLAAQTGVNGEPGYAWLENMRAYGRMIDAPDWKDHRVAGGNPCLEQSLEDSELCCLVETYPDNHDSYADFERTLKFAYLYGKTVTLGRTHWPETNRVMLRNRRIGTSMSGIQQFIAGRGIHEFKRWCENGYAAIERYDRIYSDWLAIPLSIKKTSVKPSGTVSLLAGATPGLHWPESLYYLRRMRLSLHSDLLPALRAAGYEIEPAVGSEDSTVVVSVPVAIDSRGGKLRTVGEVSMWEQMAMASFMQLHWADNQVSATVTFDRETEGGQIEHALKYHQYTMKGVSLLPRTEQGQYAQMPYQSISRDEYEAHAVKLKPLVFVRVEGEEAEGEKFCSNESCSL